MRDQYSFIDNESSELFDSMQNIYDEIDSFYAERQKKLEAGVSVAPDTTGIDFFLLIGFFTEEMHRDFDVIQKDFMDHCANKLKEFNDVAWYGEANISICSPLETQRSNVLRLIYNGAKLGDEYCVELIKRLYRTYHKKEHDSFKRFSKLGMYDIMSIAQNDNILLEDRAVMRIMAMAGFFDKELQDDCALFFKVANDRREQFLKEVDKRTSFKELSKEVIEEAAIQVDAWDAAADKDISLADAYKDIVSFTNAQFRYLGFSDHYDKKCMNNFEGGRKHMIMTLALLKTMNPERDYSFEEVQVYSRVRDLAIAITNTADTYDYEMGQLLGNDVDEDGLNESRFKPGSISVSGKCKQDIKPEPVITASIKNNNASDEDFVKELDLLRTELNKQKQINKELIEDYRLCKKNLAVSEGLNRKYEAERDELIALRTYAYNSTHTEDLPEEVNLSDKISALSERKVLIIGGHPNWINAIKKKLPTWNYIQADETTKLTPGSILGYDNVYFFTGFISHKDYYRFVEAVRKNHVPFGFINKETNVNRNIEQLYSELCE